MLDCVPKLLMGVTPGATPFAGTNEDKVLTGTGISCPEAIIAFLLLLVKTIGREITLNLPVESSALTRAVRPFPRLRKILVPPPEMRPPARLEMSFRVVGSIIGTFVFREMAA